MDNKENKERVISSGNNAIILQYFYDNLYLSNHRRNNKVVKL